MSDAPRRRANAPTDAAKPNMLKLYRVPIIIGVIWLAIMGYQVAAGTGAIEAGGDECPGHWHTGYAVIVEGERVPFNPNVVPRFGDASASPGSSSHIHGDDGLLHVHPPVGTTKCVALEDAFAKLGVEVSTSALTLDSTHFEAAGTYTANDTHEVQVHHRPWEGDWRHVDNVDSFMGRQPGNGDQVLITYVERGNAAEVDSQKTSVRSLAGDPSYEPGPAPSGFTGERIVAIIMTTVFAALALGVWNKFRVAA